MLRQKSATYLSAAKKPASSTAQFLAQCIDMDGTSQLPLHMKQTHSSPVRKRPYGWQRNRIQPGFPSPVAYATAASGASHLTSSVYALPHLYR